MQEDVHVAVAVLQRPGGEVLVAERPHWRHQGGGLEFPGGKVDPGEAVGQALSRELTEELGVEPVSWQDLVRIRHRYPDRSVVLHVAVVSEWSGTPSGVEGQAISWLPPDALDADRFPEANRPIVAALRDPAHCLVTPSVPESALPSLVDGLRDALTAGTRMIQLRAHGWRDEAWLRLVESTCDLAGEMAPEARILVNSGDPRWLERFPRLAGIHMSANDARRFGERPIPCGRILSCACHDSAEIEQAEALQANMVVVGHVKPTPSHPSMAPIGWQGLEALTASTTLPVYAIGGLAPVDLDEARRHGAVGIAAIRGMWPANR